MSADTVDQIVDLKRKKQEKKEVEVAAEAAKKPGPYEALVSTLSKLPPDRRDFLVFYSTLDEYGKASQVFSMYQELQRLTNNINFLKKELDSLKKVPKS